MPILRTKEIREMTQENRQKRLDEMQTELMRLKTMVKAGGAIENPSRVREIRKTIARILTINTEPTPIKKEEKEEKKEKEKPKPKKKTEKESEKEEKTKEKTTKKKEKKKPKKPNEDKEK